MRALPATVVPDAYFGTGLAFPTHGDKQAQLFRHQIRRLPAQFRACHTNRNATKPTTHIRTSPRRRPRACWRPG